MLKELESRDFKGTLNRNSKGFFKSKCKSHFKNKKVQRKFKIEIEKEL